VHDQALIWSHQFGVESFKTNNPVTNDTLFSICSVSKLFNGIAAMNLVEEGILELDAPLSQYNSARAALSSV
jgi:CubicO group peptidase (beta-lactamase class C family)